MYFYLYQITNIINNKIYIGVHKTKNLNDNYMGSGKYIFNAIKKHGVENFKKEILEWFNSEEDMYKREIEIVDEDFLNRPDVYNMKLGGPANFYYVNKTGLNHKVNQHLIHGNKCKTDPNYLKEFKDKMTKINNDLDRKRRAAETRKKNNQNIIRFWVSNDIEQRSTMVDEETFKKMPGWYKGVKYRKKRVNKVPMPEIVMGETANLNYADASSARNSKNFIE